MAGIVLLKNERRALPLGPARLRRVVLVGPHANASEHMLGNYYGRPARVVTPLQAFQARMPIWLGVWNWGFEFLGNYYGRPARVATPLQAFQARMPIWLGVWMCGLEVRVLDMQAFQARRFV